MRSRKLDNITSEQTDRVLSIASVVIGIGWLIIVLSMAFAFIGLIVSTGAQDGSNVGLAVISAISGGITGVAVGLILLLLGHSSRLSAFAVKGNLMDVGVGVPSPRGRFATSRFGATLVDGADGPRVVDVDSDGPVDEAGLAPGDTIVALGDLAPLSVASLATFVRSSPPGTRIDLTYLRDSEEVTVELTLG
jgi:S1-C subfamily serine protease